MNQMVKRMRRLEITTGRSSVGDFGSNLSEGGRRRTDVNLRGRLRSGWKMTVDPIAAIILLIALAPLIAVLTLVICRQSGRPIFYAQKRWGAGGRTFKCWKFRTMAIDADERLEELLSSDAEAQKEWEQFAKLKDDPRVTPIGKLLRKTSLDELPQLWNVVIGQMSLVGARPIAIGEEMLWGNQFRFYVEERPGITGHGKCSIAIVLTTAAA